MKRASVTLESLETRSMMSTVTVTSLADSGAGTLRQALADASAGDTVDLGGLSGTITLASTLQVGKSVTITGPGSGDLAINGNGHQAIVVAQSLNTTISGLTIRNSGDGSLGGAIQATGTDATRSTTSLTLIDVALKNNHATTAGGAVYLYNGRLVMADCTVSGNSVTGNGTASGGGVYLLNGAIDFDRVTFSDNHALANARPDSPDTTQDYGSSVGGGLSATGLTAATIVNSTFANNGVEVRAGANATSVAYARGGGLTLVPVAAGATVLTNVTIAGNSVVGDPHNPDATANIGGGLAVGQLGSTGSLTVRNSVIAANTSSSAPDVGTAGTYTITYAHDLVSNGSGSGATDGTNGNIVGTANSPAYAKLSPLADNGGSVQTMAPQGDSPVIDAGDAATAPADDARGQSRDSNPDLGAVEYVGLLPPPTPANHAPTITSPSADLATAGSTYSYTVIADDADGDAMNFTAASLPAWLTLTDHHDGTATLAGTPTAVNVGSVSITLQVSDGVDATDQTFTLTTSMAQNPGGTNHAPTFTTNAPPTSPVLGLPYRYDIVTADLDGDARTYSSVALPKWLTLVDHGDGTATLSGTPAPGDTAGLISIVVSDGHTSVSQNYSVGIDTPARPTTLDAGTLVVQGFAVTNDIHVWTPKGQDDVLRVVVNGQTRNYAKADVGGLKIFGGTGDDLIRVDFAGGAYVYGGDGDDVIIGGAGDDTLGGGTGNDFIDGGSGDDLINGHGGNDRLLGGDGRDRVNGNAGRDRIVGGIGVDTLDGGAGRDLLYGRDDDADVILGDANDLASADPNDVVDSVIALIA